MKNIISINPQKMTEKERKRLSEVYSWIPFIDKRDKLELSIDSKRHYKDSIFMHKMLLKYGNVDSRELKDYLIDTIKTNAEEIRFWEKVEKKI